MILPHLKPFISAFFLVGCLLSNPLLGQTFEIARRDSAYQVSLADGNLVYLSAPEEGLWSIALGWENDWPADWRHAQPTVLTRQGEWAVLSGKLQLPQGEWWFQDAYRTENGKVKCIRRFEWKGKEILDRVTLSVRWAVPSAYANAFLPGILYYGNPSGEKNGPQNVAWHHAQPGEEAFFEEHRYPMPFAGYEWAKGDRHYGAALHTIPSPVYQGNHFDQWWSLGVKNGPLHSELQLLSGPIGFNHQRSIAKALQQGPLPYKDTYLRIRPGTVIEKTFYLEAYPVKAKGSGFQKPVYTSLDLFKPFYTEDLPRYEDILRSKYRFAQSRWIEGPGYAGFNMYPSHVKPQIVLGWAGQSEAPAYALQALADELHDTLLWQKVQRSMDHIIRSPLDAEGFCVIYDVQTQAWKGKDPVSQGQAMNSIALAIEEGRKNGKVRTAEWEGFLQRAADVFAKRILSPDWSPVNTAEAFFIAPLLAAHRLLGNAQYRKAAFKAADYYAKRHLDMQEPYWGGTLDATCEDKEGAWGAFQGFLAAYESSKDQRYLEYAKHACDVTISYTAVWDIPLPAGRLADHFFKTRGWTGVSAQNQHLDVFGVVIAPSVYKMGLYLGQEDLKRLARTMYLSCGQLIAPNGAHGEQIQETNFAQHGEMDDVFKLRGGYSESWTVFWITAHFLHAAAQFKALGVTL
ncbi:MAG: hypothetical protein RL181_1467 [Bacteroidota bacterium]